MLFSTNTVVSGFLPHRSQRREEFSKWHETWQDCCLRDAKFFWWQFDSLDGHYDVTNRFQIWCQNLELRKSSEKPHRGVL